ncbi:hypothetical protein ACN42_g11992, partial [Penicillium freii]
LRYQVVIYRFYYVFWAAQLACVRSSLTDYVTSLVSRPEAKASL